MKKLIYTFYNYIFQYVGKRYAFFLESLSEKEKKDFLNEDEKIDYECHKMKIRNCEHEPVVVCKKCGEVFKIKEGKKEIKKNEKD